jgi:predicted P-loop ATPase
VARRFYDVRCSMDVEVSAIVADGDGDGVDVSGDE